MPETTEATDEQYEEMNRLASAKGYPDWTYAAAGILNRRIPELEDGIDEQDADTVIQELGGPRPHSGRKAEPESVGRVAKGDHDRAWAVGTCGITGGVWMILPGTVVAWVWLALSAFMVLMWVGNWVPDRWFPERMQ